MVVNSIRLLKKILLLFSSFFALSMAKGQDKWFLNFTPGLSLAFPAPLHISQNGYPGISFWAKYRTNPLDLPIYYSYRGGFQHGVRLTEIEMNHLKLYLKNTSELVDWFAVSHGYNQIFLNYGRMTGKFGHKAGIGLVLSHPENTIRGKRLDEKKGILGRGYYPSGIAAQYVLYKEIEVTDFFYLLLEMKASLGYARVKVVDGKADVPVAALHFLIGPGIKIKKGTSREMPSVYK